MTKNEFYKAFEPYSSLLLIFILATINIRAREMGVESI